ncbi:hypothetical protein AB0M02_39700 [Actinoplanes sp. NPDC051861]|uniref:hypothetical protein n=1 Tax=Actinoplanes sp. NPDC051861 TaxID=3155170 RepID=UPI00341ED1F3
MDTAPPAATPDIQPVGGPVSVAWREGTLTRAKELEALAAWVRVRHPDQDNEILQEAIRCHLEAARQAARVDKLSPRRRMRLLRNGPLMERASSNLDAAEAHLLNIAPADYVLGQMPCLLRHVQRHLPVGDPARVEFERIARGVGVGDPDRPAGAPADQGDHLKRVDDERGKIVTTVRSAGSAALREHVRLRSFRNVVVVTAALMGLLAIGVAFLGLIRPTLIPLCFTPEDAGVATTVCPTAQSDPFWPMGSDGTPPGGVPERDIDEVVADTATRQDLIIVELVGLTAAAVATAAAIRRIKGSSERYGLPVALAVLKLPTGAITAFLGLLLMRGQFVPGLSALDTSAQILAWALVFGYAQQLFTRLVDQQGQTVLNSVRSANDIRPTPATT